MRERKGRVTVLVNYVVHSLLEVDPPKKKRKNTIEERKRKKKGKRRKEGKRLKAGEMRIFKGSAVYSAISPLFV